MRVKTESWLSEWLSGVVQESTGARRMRRANMQVGIGRVLTLERVLQRNRSAVDEFSKSAPDTECLQAEAGRPQPWTGGPASFVHGAPLKQSLLCLLLSVWLFL